MDNIYVLRPIRESRRELHVHIFLPLMGVLGWLLQLKFVEGNVSPFVTDYVTVRTFIVAFVIYLGALTSKRFFQTPSSYMDEFMTNIILLSGTLASILLLIILVRAFGWFALFLWVIYLVRDVVTKKSYRKALIHIFVRVKVLLNGPSVENNDVHPPIPEFVVPIQEAGQQNVEEKSRDESNEPCATPLPNLVNQPAGLPV